MRKLTIFLNIIFILIGLVSILLALTSPMIFDAPGSEHNRILIVTLISALLLPIACFGSIAYSITMLVKRKNSKKALLVFIIPCVVGAIFIGSMIAIDVFCSGQFSCGYS
ncbi:MAG: hypothetical protein ABI597_13780 [Gammaproteobacteria bacterium]